LIEAIGKLLFHGLELQASGFQLAFEILSEDMLPKDLKERLEAEIRNVEHPQELAVDVMFAVQDHYGYLSDEALAEAASLLGMTPLELDELATFYTFTFREPVGKYVIHVCDSVVCWMNGYESVRDYLSRKLGVGLGETTADGLFTLLPVCCIGYCDRSPAMLVNRRVYGELTPEKIDEIIEKCRREVDLEATR
jgi:NADH-quinone oxidoreductase subunit E